MLATREGHTETRPRQMRKPNRPSIPPRAEWLQAAGEGRSRARELKSRRAYLMLASYPSTFSIIISVVFSPSLMIILTSRW